MSSRQDEAPWPLHISRMTNRMKDDIKTLNALWKEIGFTQERMDFVEKHRDMFKTMVEEEEEYKSRLIKEVKQYTDEVKDLAIDLKEEISLGENWESLVAAESALKAHLERLKIIKDERLRKYWALKSKDKCTSYRLGIDEYPAVEGNIPSTEYLKNFTKELHSKEADRKH